MKTWALANQKGGTGKTTVAINLASALALQGKRVLLVDLDPQAHATLGLGVGVDDGRSVSSVFLDGAPVSDVIRSVPSGFHLAAADARLSEFEAVAERSLFPERILRTTLESIEDRYDWLLLDCPPRVDGVLCANAVRASDTVCLVVETGAFALQGALRARALFEDFADELGGAPALRILATLYDRRERLGRDFLVALHARFGRRMLDTVIRRDERLREAAAFGVPVCERFPRSASAADFQALARELLGLPLLAPPARPSRSPSALSSVPD